jgi:N-dimethylarginine dimethylaminohydrolase
LVHGNKIYLSRFRHPERAGEQQHFAEFYKKLGLQLLGTDYSEYFEGGGDAVFSDEQTLWAGCGPRTSKKVGEGFVNLLLQHVNVKGN